MVTHMDLSTKKKIHRLLVQLTLLNSDFITTVQCNTILDSIESKGFYKNNWRARNMNINLHVIFERRHLFQK